MMQCVSRCPLPKKAAQHTALFACGGVHKCVMMYGVWWVSLSMWCCMVCGGCREKKGKRQNTQSNKNKKDFSQNHFFPFSLFSSSFSSTLFSLPSTLPPSLLSYPYTNMFSRLTHGCIRDEPKTQMTQHLILLIIFSFCPNSFFLFFSFN